MAAEVVELMHMAVKSWPMTVPLLALVAWPSLAQAPATPVPAPTAPQASVPAQPPVRSTLKPAPAPGADTSQPRQRLVTVFGTEKCPEPSSPDEVVVCARLPDSEVYRIPTPLRAANSARVSPFQANRSLLLGDASGGAGGSIGSCSSIGSGGASGCNQRQIDAWAQDRTGRMGVEEATPE